MRSTRTLAVLALAVLLPAGGAPAAAEADSVETATFAMYCYWTGEATVGRVDGVVATRIGFRAGKEIIEVDYDPARTDVGKLASALIRQRSFDALLVASEAEKERAGTRVPGESIWVRPGKARLIEPKHSLRTRHPELWELGLSEAQAIALNSWSYFGGPMPGRADRRAEGDPPIPVAPRVSRRKSGGKRAGIGSWSTGR